MNSSLILIGYHGCDITTVYDVVLDGNLNPSRNTYDWLGNGIYFWEDDIERGSTPKSVDFNERRRIGQGPSIDNFQSFYSRRLGVVLASSCGGSPR